MFGYIIGAAIGGGLGYLYLPLCGVRERHLPDHIQSVHLQPVRRGVRPADRRDGLIPYPPGLIRRLLRGGFFWCGHSGRARLSILPRNARIKA